MNEPKTVVELIYKIYFSNTGTWMPIKGKGKCLFAEQAIKKKLVTETKVEETTKKKIPLKPAYEYRLTDKGKYLVQMAMVPGEKMLLEMLFKPEKKNGQK